MRVEQAVIRVRQATVRLEPGRLTGGHDRRQTRVLGDHETPAERFMHQAHGRQRTQAVAIQTQQPHRATTEVLAQGMHQTLQAHGIGQFGDEIGEQTGFQHGIYHPNWSTEP
ncbi:hypothetical protein D3C72_1618920 [compost metagenome]